jgi:phosphinothricin acetyltransferase
MTWVKNMSSPLTTDLSGKSRPQLQVRAAEERDANDIARIYMQAIQDHLATFEHFLVTPEERARWVTEHSGKYPLLVAELNGRVLGWTSLSPYQVRPRIAGIAELLIYIDRDYRRHGVGRELMRAIQSAAREEGHHKLIGRFVAHNDAGRTLCRMTGWREVGVHQKHTLLDGRWHDVVVVEFLITENLGSQEPGVRGQ